MSPMKPLATLALALLCTHSLNAQDQRQAQADIDRELPIPSSVFVPPPPPKAVPPIRVEATTTRRFPTHRVTVLRGEASTLPDIPPPAQPRPHAPPSVGESGTYLSFGVTVYDHRLSHARWHDPRTGRRFEAWCAWDWTLLSPICELKVGGRVGMFHVFAWNIDTDEGARSDGEFKMPAHPGLEAHAFAITEGDPDDADAVLILGALRDYYLEHEDRLLLIRQAGEEYQAAAAAWHAANPPRPRDHTFWLRPHRGSRYLRGEGGER